MEFLTASQSTEGGDCADAELANTKSDIERIRMGFLDPSRDQDWARFPGQYAVGHPNPLLSVIVCRSSQLESSIAALARRMGGASCPQKLKERRRKRYPSGSDTHQLQLAKMMGFCETLNPSDALVYPAIYHSFKQKSRDAAVQSFASALDCVWRVSQQLKGGNN